MLKFLKKTILIVLLPTLFYFASIEFLVRSIPNDYAYKAKYLIENGKNLKFISLGSSNAYYGISPNEFEFKGLNLANVSQNANYDLFILKESIRYCDSLKYVIFPLTYPTFLYDLSNAKEFWRVTNYNIFFDGKFKEWEPKFNFITYNTNLKSPLKRIYKFYANLTSELSCDDKGYGIREDPTDYSDFSSYGPLYAKWHNEMYDSVAFIENIKSFRKIVDLCKKEKIKLIIPYIPAFKSYTENVDSNLLKITKETVINTAKKNDNVYYLDLMNDSRFKIKDFYDPNHLSNRGAKKFSKILNQLLKEIN